MKRILKWGGITILIILVIFILLIIFVPSSNKSFEEGREAGLNSRQKQQSQESTSNEDKKRIYKEVVAAEDKGRIEAENQCPTDTSKDPLYEQWQEMSDEEQQEYLQKCSNLQTQLSEQYRNEVLVKYGMSSEEWSTISVEANKEQWTLD